MSYTYRDPTDLQFPRARYYDPAVGRFLSEDPLPTMQRYSYAGSNPVNLTDPAGLWPTLADLLRWHRWLPNYEGGSFAPTPIGLPTPIRTPTPLPMPTPDRRTPENIRNRVWDPVLDALQDEDVQRCMETLNFAFADSVSIGIVGIVVRRQVPWWLEGVNASKTFTGVREACNVQEWD